MELRKDKPKLELQHGICPACGARIDRGMRLCVRCGLDLRTGRTYRTNMQSDPGNWGRIAVILLFLVIVSVAIAYWPRAKSWYETGIAKLEEDRVAVVRTYMDDAYPLCKLGETVTVKSATGEHIVGVFAGSGPGGILMHSLQGRLATLPLQLFYPAELLRFDEYLRLVVLRKHAELPYAHHQRLRLLISQKEVDLDFARTVELVRGRQCSLCNGVHVMSCETCGGRGRVPVKMDKHCPQCKGTGVHVARMGGSESQCPFCRGVGAVQDATYDYCPDCEGTGKRPCSACMSAKK